MRSSSPGSDYDDYLSTLKKKTIGNISDFHIDGLSDLSLSELSEKKYEKTKIPSKFLKKSNSNENQQLSSNKDVKIVKEKKKKLPKDNLSKNSKKKSKSKKSKEIIKISKSDIYDSDLNMSLSSMSATNRPINSFVPKLSLKDNHKEHYIKSDDDESSFGKDGHRFFKPKVVQPKVSVIENDIGDLSTARDISSPRKSTLRSARTIPSIKKVTIADPISTKPLSTSLDKSISSESISERNSNFCGQKIMSLDYFENDEELIEEKMNETSRSDSHSPSFVGEKIMSITDLENEDYLINQIEKVVDDENSSTEIRTLPQVTPRKLSLLSKDQSVSEIITVPGTERSNVRSSGSKQYSMEFEESVSKDKPSSTTPMKKSVASYSSDFTKDDLSLNSESAESSIKKKPVKEKYSKHLKYHWDKRVSGEPYVPPGLGMQNVDPTPIAQYVVSPEALESVTAYSPCMILLTNMLRQQLQMTTSFIDTQRRLYDSMMSSIKPSYQYCTLDDTKEFIRINKSKGLSSKETQQLIEKDY